MYQVISTGPRSALFKAALCEAQVIVNMIGAIALTDDDDVSNFFLPQTLSTRPIGPWDNLLQPFPEFGRNSVSGLSVLITL